MKKILTPLLCFATIIGCTQNISVNDVDIEQRLFSPDSSYVALTFNIDHGAMGGTSTMSSLLRVADTAAFINKYNFPCQDLPFYSCYYPDHWIDKKTLQVFLNERPFVRAGLAFDRQAFELNGIKCVVVPNDISYKKSPLIESFAFSQDRKKLLVNYQYEGDPNISVINYADALPRIGNLYTNIAIDFNPVAYSKWNGNNIEMFIIDADMHKQEDPLNKNNGYPVKFMDAKDLKELKQNEIDVKEPELDNDKSISSYLTSKGVKMNATITEAQWRKPGNQSLFYYEYEYTVNGKTYRSSFKMYSDFNSGYEYKTVMLLRYCMILFSH